MAAATQPHHGATRLEDPDLEGHGGIAGIDSEDEAETGPAHAVVPTSTAFLDGLRGQAALSVLVQHYLGFFDGNVHDHGFGEKGQYFYLASLPVVRLFFSGGSVAVAVFFVLSGYVLSRSPLRHLAGGSPHAPTLSLPTANAIPSHPFVRSHAQVAACLRSVASAIVRRPVRLYLPAIVAALALAIGLHVPILQQWAPEPKESVLAELINFVHASLIFFNPFREHDANRNWYPYGFVFWTVPLELKGSMMVFTLVGLLALVTRGVSLWLSSSHRSALAGNIVFVVACTAAPILCVVAYLLLHFGHWVTFCFLVGLALSINDTFALDELFLRRLNVIPQERALIRHGALVVGLYFMSQPSHAQDMTFAADTPGWRALTLKAPVAYRYDQLEYFRYYHSLGASLFVYALLRTPRAQRVFGWRPLRELGRVSYMLYLTHVPMINAIGGRIGQLLGAGPGPKEHEEGWAHALAIPDWGPAGLNTRFLLSMAVFMPIALVVAHYSTVYLDGPSIRLGKRLARRLGLENSATVDDRALPMQERLN